VAIAEAAAATIAVTGALTPVMAAVVPVLVVIMLPVDARAARFGATDLPAAVAM
jgi:hypothetical protein